MNKVESKKVECPEFYDDEETGIKKHSFIIRCSNCSIHQRRKSKQCNNDGYCRFSKLFDEINAEFSEKQRVRIVSIIMSGYNKPRW